MNDLNQLQMAVKAWHAPADPTAYQQWWDTLPDHAKPVYIKDVEALNAAMGQTQPVAEAPVAPVPPAPVAQGSPTTNAFVPTAPPTGTALAPMPQAQPGTAVATAQGSSILAGMRNARGGGVPIITVTQGFFNMPNATGAEPVTEFYGIIIGARGAEQKSYYANPYNPKAKAGAPDCQSIDGDYPHPNVKNPVHPDCLGCPMNKFGSAKIGKGKACNDKKAIAVVMHDKTSGSVFKVMLPATAITPLDLYAKDLSQKGYNPAMVITRFYFGMNKNNFSIVQFEAVEQVSKTQAEDVEKQMDSGIVARVLEPFTPKAEDDDAPTTPSAPVAPTPPTPPMPNAPVAPVPSAPTSPMLSQVPTTAPQFTTAQPVAPVPSAPPAGTIQPPIPVPTLPQFAKVGG